MSRREDEPLFTQAEEASWNPGPHRLAAEVIGAFALTSVAAGADVAAAITGGQVSYEARAIAPGLLVMALIYALGDVSGLHINPAVTLGFTLKRLFPWRWLPTYWLAQLLGAVAAGVALVALFGPTSAQAGVNEPHIDSLAALAIEVFLTWLLVTVILGTADRAHLVGPNAALAVGGTIILCGLIALPITGASMNPARSTGPALATGDVSDLWLYWLGPMVGSMLAVAVAGFLHGARTSGGESEKSAKGERA
jgi:aquaporin Z